MLSFHHHLRIGTLLVLLGCMTASYAHQGKNPKDVLPGSHAARMTVLNAATKAVGQTAFGKRPISFEANRGQSDAQVQFLSRGHGYRLSLSPTEAIVTLQPSIVHRTSQTRNIAAGRQATEAQPPATRIRLQLVGANPHAVVSGINALPGQVNYIIGRDAAQWHTQIPTYAKVKYERVYPGIDLIYYGNDRGRLEYDFRIDPYADPTTIALKFDGVDALDVDVEGNLVLRTASGEVHQKRPHIYQEVAGGRQTISGSYVIRGAYEVGFAIGDYDTARPLVIDPEIVYSTYLGSVSEHEFASDEDTGNGIAVDAAGNIYVVGTTNVRDRYDADVVVRQFDPSGSQLLYETYLDSGQTDDAGWGITVDAAGNAYLTGQFGDGQLGRGFGVLVAKLSPVGIPLYQVTFGANSGAGFSQDVGAHIAVDDAGNAYVVGTTYGLGQPFPTTPGAFQESFRGNSDAFVVKLDQNGRIVYATLLGGAGYDEGQGIALGKVGNVTHAYVIGTASVVGDFPTTPGTFQATFGGVADAFVAQLNDTGSALVYSTYLGGTGSDWGVAIAVDTAGNAYLTGSTREDLSTLNTFPVVNAFQPTYGGHKGTPAAANAFVAKLNATGSALIYSSYMGGSGGSGDAGHAITVDGAGYAYLTGITTTRPDVFTGDRFPIVNAFQPEPGGGMSSFYSDAFVAKLTPEGALVYSSYLGGNYQDSGNGIALDTWGNVYVTGSTSSGDFPITIDAFQPQITGGGCSYPFTCPDAFITKISD